MTKRGPIIAIDGPSASGKNAVGSEVARRLECLFVDTGAMYRAVTWLAQRRGVAAEDEDALNELALTAQLTWSRDSNGSYRIEADGTNVTQAVRSAEVEREVSTVSRWPGVRQALVSQQRRLVAGGGVVMVGRDIGTEVLPQADLKVFLAASIEERARRRHQELLDSAEPRRYEALLLEMQQRDTLDSQRKVSPLRPADDATIVETDNLSVEDVVQRVIALAKEKGTFE